MKFPYALMLIALVGLGSVSFANDEEGFVSLFDGKSLEHWGDRRGKPVKESIWKAEDGCMVKVGRGDIYSIKEYKNFDFRFEWKIAPRGNSGVKYRMANYSNSFVGPEFQVLDDKVRGGSGDPSKNTAASLYDVFGAKDKQLNPVDQFNSSRIVANGNNLQHWLNGKKVVDLDITSDEWKAAISKSKFRKRPDFASKKGKFMLQDHGAKVWFRNLRIKELPE